MSFGDNIKLSSLQNIYDDTNNIIDCKEFDINIDNSDYIKYPRQRMSANTLTYSGINSNATVSVKASSYYNHNGDYDVYRSFDGVIRSGDFSSWGWCTSSASYINGTNSTYNKSDYPGEWLMIDLGESIVLKKLNIFSRSDNSFVRKPKSFKIYGSNNQACYNDINHSSWTPIYTGEDPNPTGVQLTSYIIKNNASYRYYVIVINKIHSTVTEYCQIGEMELYSGNQGNFKINNKSKRNSGIAIVADKVNIYGTGAGQVNDLNYRAVLLLKIPLEELIPLHALDTHLPIYNDVYNNADHIHMYVGNLTFFSLKSRWLDHFGKISWSGDIWGMVYSPQVDMSTGKLLVDVNDQSLNIAFYTNTYWYTFNIGYRTYVFNLDKIYENGKNYLQIYFNNQDASYSGGEVPGGPVYWIYNSF